MSQINGTKYLCVNHSSVYPVLFQYYVTNIGSIQHGTRDALKELLFLLPHAPHMTLCREYPPIFLCALEHQKYLIPNTNPVVLIRLLSACYRLK